MFFLPSHIHTSKYLYLLGFLLPPLCTKSIAWFYSYTLRVYKRRDGGRAGAPPLTFLMVLHLYPRASRGGRKRLESIYAYSLGTSISGSVRPALSLAFISPSRHTIERQRSSLYPTNCVVKRSMPKGALAVYILVSSCSGSALPYRGGKAHDFSLQFSCFCGEQRGT